MVYLSVEKCTLSALGSRTGIDKAQGPATPLLGMYPKEIKSLFPRLPAPMFIAVLFTSHNCQDMEPTELYIMNGYRKLVQIHSRNGSALWKCHLWIDKTRVHHVN